MAMHAHAAASAGFVPVALMWVGMMTAMMTPTVWPWIRVFADLGTRADRGFARARVVAGFAGGYFSAWTLYAMAAALLQILAGRVGLLDPVRGLTPGLGAAVLLVAGAYQFAPLKRACLIHCRSPFGYFLSRWPSGPIGGFRMGFGHGLFCVGCCWALMATVFAVGVMNVWWMAALAAAAFVEQVVPFGDRLRVPLGLTLVVVGLARL
jgi:predicted metal-binding membrane protein